MQPAKPPKKSNRSHYTAPRNAPHQGDRLEEAKRRIDLARYVANRWPDANARPGRPGTIKAAWRDDRKPSCSINERGGVWFWNDQATGEGGTIVDLLMAADGLSRADAVAATLELAGLGKSTGLMLAAAPVVYQRPERDVKAEERQAARARARVARIYQETFPLEDARAEPVHRYLARRGLVGATSPVLRFHPALTYYQDGKPVGTFPAMVARVDGPTGNPVGIHVTYLTHDGFKAEVPAARKLLVVRPGAAMGAAIRLDSEPGQRLAVCEGLESALAFTALTGWACWAAISAGGLERVEVPGWVDELIIAADHDPRGLQVANKLARRLLPTVREVKIRKPATPGQDWNDHLIEVSRP